MAEYIEREALINSFWSCGASKDLIDSIVYRINLQKAAVDAVPVVRCKDCKHYKPQKKSAHWEHRANYCNRIVTIKVRPYDFCSYGERKNEVSE